MAERRTRAAEAFRMNHEPSTGAVRSSASEYDAILAGGTMAFDLWLAGVKAQVWDEAWEAAYRWHELGASDATDENPYS